MYIFNFLHLIGLLIIGIKQSSNFNIIFTGFNLIIIIFIVFAGATKADIKNWKLKTSVTFFRKFTKFF